MGGGAASASGAEGLLLLADISGYTGFLQAVGHAHGEQMAAMPEPPAAYPLMTTLLDGIVEKVAPPFHLSKLEGDAVFAYARGDEFELRGNAVIECMKTCYESFRQRRDDADNLMLCSCAACSLLPTLELKFVLHGGHYVMQSIAGRDELLGPAVTAAHLLLKNTVTAELGHRAYALLTEQATGRLDVPVVDAVPHIEHYEHYPPISTFVFAF